MTIIIPCGINKGNKMQVNFIIKEKIIDVSLLFILITIINHIFNIAIIF